jgi:glycosyltransferase involved in cell wall biosynthesis
MIDKNTIAAAVMVKNEESRILTTISSVHGKVDGIILCDTGSCDNTIDLVEDFAKDHDMKFHLLKISFEDFSTTRNKMLEFANNLQYDYLLLLDSNDELKCEQKDLYKLVENNKESDVFMIQQSWFTGFTECNFSNIRLIRNREKYRYKGCVHEFLDVGKDKITVVKAPLKPSIVIYQDRVLDNDGKTRIRWKNDEILLKKELALNPSCSRTQYYLAQTYDCLNRKKDAYFYYRMRSKNKNGFFEERFLSMMKCADFETDEEEKIMWCLRAFDVLERAEPLVTLCRVYRAKNKFKIAQTFAKLACSLPYPDECILFVDQKMYSNDRWQEMAICSFYIQEFKEGRSACLKAIESGYDKELNEKNLTFYDKL